MPSIVVAVPVNWFFGLYASIVRYTGLTLLYVGMKATFFVTAALMAVSSLAGLSSAPIRVGIVYWAFSLILIVGGHYTYAEVPLFDRLAEWMGSERNNYDKVGHFFQGFAAGVQGLDDFYQKAVVLNDGAVAFQKRL